MRKATEIELNLFKRVTYGIHFTCTCTFLFKQKILTGTKCTTGNSLHTQKTPQKNRSLL